MVGLAPIHLLGVTISFVLFYQSTQLIKDRKESVFEFLVWSGFGFVILLLSLGDIVTTLGILNFTVSSLQYLGFQSGVNGIFTLAILIILMMLFYTYVNVLNNRKRVSSLNQEVAILKYEVEQATENEEIPTDED